MMFHEGDDSDGKEDEDTFADDYADEDEYDGGADGGDIDVSQETTADGQLVLVDGSYNAYSPEGELLGTWDDATQTVVGRGDAEDEVTAMLAALLPHLSSEEVDLYVKNGDGELRGQATAIKIAYLDWLPDALLRAHASPESKTQARRLLGSTDVFDCSDLERIQLDEAGGAGGKGDGEGEGEGEGSGDGPSVWDCLREKLGGHMAAFGASLRNIYESEDLRGRLGSYPANMIQGGGGGLGEGPASKTRQDSAGGVPLPPGLTRGTGKGASAGDGGGETKGSGGGEGRGRCEDMSESDERCYIHFLRLIAVAVDPAFQDAVNACLTPARSPSVIEGGYTYHAGIKSYARMAAKMLTRAHHRYDQKPRPALNVDINRCRAVAADADKMVAVLDALQERFGGFVGFKNGMALSDEDAAKVFHLRVCEANVMFEHPTLKTFRELSVDEDVQALWQAYAEGEGAGEGAEEARKPRGQWGREVARALEWLRSEELATEPVRMVCEVQCLLSPYRDVRMDMHEVYKAYRADSPASLHAINRKYGNAEPALEASEGGDTPLLGAAGGGDVDLVRELVAVEDVNVANEESGATPMYLASEKGHVGVVRVLLRGKNVGVNQTNDEGATPLYVAAKGGHVEVVRELLRGSDGVAGADVNQAEQRGATPLFVASQLGHVDVVQELLEGGGGGGGQSSINVNQAVVGVSQTYTSHVCGVCVSDGSALTLPSVCVQWCLCVCAYVWERVCVRR